MSLIGLLILGVFFAVQLIKFFPKSSYEVQNVDFTFAGIGKVTVVQDKNTVRLAHKAWVQLTTRKAELPFDESHDLIVDIYDSWYQLFGELRKIVEDASPSLRRKQDLRNSLLINSVVGTLNEGLRPHLTEWQAKYRRWYTHEIESSKNLKKSPQEIQKTYPFYSELVLDLIKTNNGLAKYSSELKRISQGGDGLPKRWKLRLRK